MRNVTPQGTHGPDCDHRRREIRGMAVEFPPEHKSDDITTLLFVYTTLLTLVSDRWTSGSAATGLPAPCRCSMEARG